jgi:hypothetical protein
MRAFKSTAVPTAAAFLENNFVACMVRLAKGQALPDKADGELLESLLAGPGRRLKINAIGCGEKPVLDLCSLP